MGAFFLDAVFGKHQDPLGVLDRGQTMGYDERGAVFGQFLKRILNG